MTLFRFPDEVNDRAARLLAASVATLVVMATATQSAWALPILSAGFLLRWGFGPRFSPLARLAVFVAPRITNVRMVAGPPKRFAQAIGAIFLVTASGLVLLGDSRIGWALASVVAVFATLEAVLGFCMGCWVYRSLIRLGIIAADRCEDCVPVPQH
jgi:hypothetical protein